MDTLARTGVTIPENDGSDSTSAYRLSMRSIGLFLEASGVIYGAGTLAGRPVAGKAGRVYKATDAGLEGVFYWDTGSVWQIVGAAPPSDPVAGTAGLRTLGSGSQQAAPGNHTHGNDLEYYARMGAL